MTVTLIEGPTDDDWMSVKRRALVTIGKEPVTSPTLEWKASILEARHSPIRRLHFAFLFEGIPYSKSVHFCRHKHAEPFVKSQRNDRQQSYNRDEAPQNAPVNMILDVNAEELMIIANKRLCNQADEETRSITREMAALVVQRYPEFDGLLVPMCMYHGGTCHEMKPCGLFPKREFNLHREDE